MSKREEIEAYVKKFAEGFTKLLREAAHETVEAAFADGASEEAEPAPAKKPRKTLRSARAVKALPPSRGGWSTDAVLAAVKANPGARSETIAAHLEASSREIKRPLAELVAIGKVKKSGNGRGTTYTAGR